MYSAVSRLSYKGGKAYATISKVIMGNGGFYGCLIEPQVVSAWWKKTAQKRVFLLSRSLLLNYLEPQSSKPKLLLPIMPIDIVAYTFTLLWDNLCRNSCTYSYNDETFVRQLLTSDGSFVFDVWFYDLDDVWKQCRAHNS